MDKILLIINAWDPIGLFPMAPKDEYMNEIQKIYMYLDENQNITTEELAKKINEIFLMSFGNDVYDKNIEECLKVAKNILIKSHL